MTSNQVAELKTNVLEEFSKRYEDLGKIDSFVFHMLVQEWAVGSQKREVICLKVFSDNCRLLYYFYLGRVLHILLAVLSVNSNHRF